jgi:hypothetical protein
MIVDRCVHALRRAPEVVAVRPDRAVTPRHVLRAPVVGHEAAARQRRVPDRLAAVIELTVPDEDVAGPPVNGKSTRKCRLTRWAGLGSLTRPTGSNSGLPRPGCGAFGMGSRSRSPIKRSLMP